jgi:hypothetical protein
LGDYRLPLTACSDTVNLKPVKDLPFSIVVFIETPSDFINKLEH